jgi:hypothetical protein
MQWGQHRVLLLLFACALALWEGQGSPLQQLRESPEALGLLDGKQPRVIAPDCCRHLRNDKEPMCCKLLCDGNADVQILLSDGCGTAEILRALAYHLQRH